MVLGLERGKEKEKEFHSKKKNCLATPFRRLGFTLCRWEHHFTKLHIIGFVYYSSLLTITHFIMSGIVKEEFSPEQFNQLARLEKFVGSFLGPWRQELVNESIKMVVTRDHGWAG